MPAVIRAAAAVHAWSRAISSSRLVVMTSNATKCSRSCCGVVMPAWCSPVNATASDAAAAVLGTGSGPLARPMAAPATVGLGAIARSAKTACEVTTRTTAE